MEFSFDSSSFFFFFVAANDNATLTMTNNVIKNVHFIIFCVLSYFFLSRSCTLWSVLSSERAHRWQSECVSLTKRQRTSDERGERERGEMRGKVYWHSLLQIMILTNMCSGKRLFIQESCESLPLWTSEEANDDLLGVVRNLNWFYWWVERTPGKVDTSPVY